MTSLMRDDVRNSYYFGQFEKIQFHEQKLPADFKEQRAADLRFRLFLCFKRSNFIYRTYIMYSTFMYCIILKD